MKIVCISDTHGFHKLLHLPEGDMIIHAGDITKRGEKTQVLDFLNWYTKLDFKYKIFIAGNHDFYFENTSVKEIDEIMPSNIIYLKDSGVVIERLKIWGSPVQPWFHNWAFNLERGKEIREHWEKIPSQLDILITHGPAHGILDLTIQNESVGCEDLLKKIKETKPRTHISGHIHEAYGRIKMFGTDFINASVLNQNYRLTNSPIVIELENKTTGNKT